MSPHHVLYLVSNCDHMELRGLLGSMMCSEGERVSEHHLWCWDVLSDLLTANGLFQRV